MSRIAKMPVPLPKGVEATLNGAVLAVKGPKGRLELVVHEQVEAKLEDNVLKFAPRTQEQQAIALAGTIRALANNMVNGVSTGFEKKLELVGVGYRAQAQGKNLNLTLGFSHPVVFAVPEGITIETPSQTEIIVRGCDRQVVGEVAAKIRAYRPPEPYKGKGVRYSDERVVRKEAKKK
ncbi:MAG: 50S ribosomal protein L6 [Xanthomonadaceae bacterium]|nr:50S ribosomal protein L6 [Xanthomonadaceae bacterium]